MICWSGGGSSFNSSRPAYLCLLFTALAPSLPLLVLAQFLTGLTATSAQIIIPLSLEIAPVEQRGKIVGHLMAGVLCGILLARMVSGFVAVWLGWRAIFWLAAGLMILLAFALRAGLPHRPPSLRLSYPALMRTLLHLSVEQPRIWPSSLVSALSFACFTALWTTLSFLMQSHFHRGAGETGLFGLVGLIGALAAPLMGRLTDHRGPAFTLTLCLLITILSFGLMWQWVTLWSLVIGILFMDLGVQSIQIAAQSKVITLVAAARSRLNTIYMVMRFIGGAAGLLLGALAWVQAGWNGVCVLSLALLALALVIHLFGTAREKSQPAPTLTAA
ncbi:MAG: MFS transporter [Chthoniobacteraceae bacterium]